MSADELIQTAVIDILSEDATLAAIPPTAAAFTDEDTELPETSLVVTASSTGKEIDYLYGYEVAVTLRKVFRGDTTVAEFEALWELVRTQVTGWYAIFTSPLPILSDIDHLTIEEIDSSSEVEVSDQHISRTLSFQAWIKAA